MQNNVILPHWLDKLIYEQLGAKYCRSNADMTVIDWDKNDVLNYLGTYFPRSYAESYCIFSEFFKNQPERFANKTELTVFDFGCGTGGEIIGVLNAIGEKRNGIKNINIYALDGNLHALRLYEEILKHYENKTCFTITNHILPSQIDDIYDLRVICDMLSDIVLSGIDIFLSFKAICEFVTKQQFEEENPYKHIVEVFKPALNYNGIMCLADVTIYSNVSEEWLPNMMDKGIQSSNILYRNEFFNSIFKITHSRKTQDISKIAWRIIE